MNDTDGDRPQFVGVLSRLCVEEVVAQREALPQHTWLLLVTRKQTCQRFSKKWALKSLDYWYVVIFGDSLLQIIKSHNVSKLLL